MLVCECPPLPLAQSGWTTEYPSVSPKEQASRISAFWSIDLPKNFLFRPCAVFFIAADVIDACDSLIGDERRSCKERRRRVLVLQSLDSGDSVA